MTIKISKNSYRQITIIIQLAVFFLSLLVGCFIWYDGAKPEYYTFLPLLPVSFGVLFIICTIKNSDLLFWPPTIIAMGLYFVRNVVTPLFMFLGNYRGYFTKLYSDNVNKGLALMIYETAIVFIFFTVYCRRKIRERTCHSVEKQKNSLFVIILTGMLLFCVACYAIRPDIGALYHTIFYETGLRDGQTLLNIGTGGTLSRGIVTLFNFVFPLTYMFIAVSIIKWLSTHLRSSLIWRTLLIIAAICIPFLFMEGGDGKTLIFVVTLLLVAIKLSEDRKEAFIRIISFLGVLALAYIAVQASGWGKTYSQYKGFEVISRMLQAYLPGVCNMAGIFNIGTYDKLSEFFFDIYSTIPFRNTLFGLSGFINLPNLYTIDNAALSHIIPCVGHAFYYIGIFSPIIPCLIYRQAFKIYSRIKSVQDPNVYMAYIALFIYLELAPVMYNIVILGAQLFASLLPMLLISFTSCTRRVRIKRSVHEIQI